MPPPNRQKPTVIVRRRPVEEDEAPQGHGTWKIAYADFVTAMMAFFMLLWLVNITTPEQRDGIADYFNPISVSDSNSGADGQLAGRAVDSEGSLTEKPSSSWETIPAARVPTLSPAGPDRMAMAAGDAESMVAGKPDAGEAGDLTLGEVKAGDVAAGRTMEPALQERLNQVQAEERAFDRIEEQVRDALLAAAELSDLSQNLMFERTTDGLRIQITDRPYFSMFEVGSVELNDRAAALMQVVADALAPVPNRIAIAGHTDGRSFAPTARYTNWELSADRANAARRLLTGAGIPPARLARVEGLADTLHIYPESPEDARNRRISITVLRRIPLAGLEGQAG
ncbi:flagellar motor protein MotB [Indioceanicola profundi]|uniref:flagellar motor protein MotB n=1 Tax=Indioceanicola profundi TaxID=2220096 RepID=UPI000E6ADA12|nr:flagellar motor protein MotB [Indioceanicola profundi]